MLHATDEGGEAKTGKNRERCRGDCWEREREREREEETRGILLDRYVHVLGALKEGNHEILSLWMKNISLSLSSTHAALSLSTLAQETSHPTASMANIKQNKRGGGDKRRGKAMRTYTRRD